MKKNLKGVAYILASSLMTSTLVGCNTEAFLNNANVKEVSDTDFNFIRSISVNNVSKEQVLANLQQLYLDSGKPVSKLLEEDPTDLLYSSGLLIKAYDSGIKEEDLINELDTIMIYTKVFNVLEKSVADKLLTNLSKTVEKDENAFDVYYPLAFTVHMYSCDLEHSIDKGYPTCDNLDKQYEEGLNDIAYVNYIHKSIMESEDENMINAYNILFNSNVDMNKALDELHNVYLLKDNLIVYQEESWNKYYATLLSTLEDGTELYNTYYNLASYVNELDQLAIAKKSDNTLKLTYKLV